MKLLFVNPATNTLGELSLEEAAKRGIKIGKNVELGEGILLHGQCQIEALDIGSHAIIGSGVKIGKLARIGHYAYIGAGSRVGSRAVVMEDAKVETGVSVGEKAVIGTGARIGSNSKIGRSAHVDDGSYVPPFTIVPDNFGWSPETTCSAENILWSTGVPFVNGSARLFAAVTPDLFSLVGGDDYQFKIGKGEFDATLRRDKWEPFRRNGWWFTSYPLAKAHAAGRPHKIISAEIKLKDVVDVRCGWVKVRRFADVQIAEI